MSAPCAIREQLQELADPEYKAFHCRLIPTVPSEQVLGVRTPALRQYARRLAGTPEAAAFLQALPHTCYEENNLHGFLLERITDSEEVIAALDRFLPYVDNWATCDMVSPKAFARHPSALEPAILRWLDDPHPYTVRYGINQLMRHFLADPWFDPAHPARIASLQREDYYIQMGAAWYFATALAMQPAAILPFFEENKLNDFVHNKGIQKAIESRRISSEQKAYLRTLRR